MITLNIPLFYRRSKRHPYVIPICLLTCATINPQWLELPVSRTNFHSPKDVRAIEVPLYMLRITQKAVQIYNLSFYK